MTIEEKEQDDSNGGGSFCSIKKKEPYDK